MRYLLSISILCCMLPPVFGQSDSTISVSSDQDSVYFEVNGEKAAIANTDMAQYYLEEGITAAVAGDYAGAENKFRVGLLYDLTNAELVYNLGLAQYYQEKYGEAIKTFDTAAELDPENPEVYNQRGLSKAMLTQYPEAELDFKILLKIAPSHPMGNFNYGILLLQMDDITGACNYLNIADSYGYPNAPVVLAEYCR